MELIYRYALLSGWKSMLLDSNARQVIINAPAIDVPSMKRARWNNKYRSGAVVDKGVVSSCCDMWNERKTNYCPHCGAKMN